MYSYNSRSNFIFSIKNVFPINKTYVLDLAPDGWTDGKPQNISPWATAVAVAEA